MKKLCNESDVDACRQIQKMLLLNSIESVIKEPAEDLLPGIKEPHLPEIWIVNDDDYEKAWSLLNSPTSADSAVEPDAE